MEPLKWQEYEFEFSEKGPDWFWGVGILGGSLAILAIVFGNLLLGVLAVVATVAIISLGNKEPKLIDCEINHKGIKMHGVLYPYIYLDHYNVVEEPKPKLILKSSKFFMPLIVVPLGTINIFDVIDLLSDKIERDERLHEPFAHHLMDRFGF